MIRVAVLGCGPAGLLVAHAVQEAGHEPVIFSKKQKSVIPGSQHLHGAVPGVTPLYPEGTIQFVRIGTAEGYAQKVYGDASRATGWEHYLQVYPSWNVLKAYDKLWERFESSIQDREISWGDPGWLGQMYDAVISTVPARVLCGHPSRHEFRGVPYFLKRLPTPVDDAEHEIVVYNGLPSDSWYRWSILGGMCSIEYTEPPPGISQEWGLGWSNGLKAVDNNCTCWPTVHRAGRWAEWRHGVTMHQAYLKAKQIAEAL